ncbi:hypothetical protein ABLB84_11465 [Xenorhabdus szentirmaii]|uniref:hypothetical protein n=1 Tax=Xenorhabdus szentirmaii TaxID=290112 RepID=UPI0032B7FCC2
MSLIKNIIVLSSFILSMSIISHAHAGLCIPKSQGEIKEITIAEDGYHFSVSFGTYTEVQILHELNDAKGMGVLNLLVTAMSRKGTVYVKGCKNGIISSIKVSMFGLSNPISNTAKEDNIEIG